MEVALCNANPDSQSKKKGSKGDLQCSSVKDTQMEEPSDNVGSDLLQVEALSWERPKRKRKKKKSSAPLVSVGTLVAENGVPIVDSTLHPRVAEFSEQVIEQEVSEPIAGLSCSRKKKGKPKKRRKSRDGSKDENYGNDVCDGTSPAENEIPGIDLSQQAPVSGIDPHLPQPVREGVSLTSGEDPRPSTDSSCSRKKKGKLKKRCKSRDGNDESCGNDICDGTSPVESIDPSQQPPVSEFSEQPELPHPLMEMISITSSEDPKPSAKLSCSQENKKRDRKNRRKTNANNGERCENDEESCGKDKRCDPCAGASLVDNIMPGIDPSQQAVVSEISKQKVELPLTDMEGISPTSSEGPKPDADLSSLQKNKKKNRKKRRKTQESDDKGCADDKTCERNDESCGENKTCKLVLSTSVEYIIPGLDPSQQPLVTELSEQKQDLPHPAQEGISPTSSEGPNPDTDLSRLQEKKKKNRKRRRKTQESNDEGCADKNKTCDRNDESCGEDKTCHLSLGTSVKNIIPGLDPSQQPPVSEVSEHKQDLPHPAKEGISSTNSEGPNPDTDLLEKKKNRKRRRKTEESNDEGCADDTTYERNDESCGDEDKTCNLSLGTSVVNIMPGLDTSQQPPVSELSEQLQDERSLVLQISDSAVERSLASGSKKKLLILDLNGFLADIVSQERSAKLLYEPDITISRKAVFKRPYCDEFLQFCFDKFNVGVWSSRTRKNVDMAVDFLFGDSRNKLLFCWDQKHCTTTRFKTLDNKDKPIVLKELRKVWEKLDPDLPWVPGEYNESNTILLDDSPYKALRNPVNTAIFPYSYHYKHRSDQALGPSGRLRKYLVKLADADNVQKFVEQNPFGQRAITETDLSWEFYRRVMEDGVQSPTNQ